MKIRWLYSIVAVALLGLLFALWYSSPRRDVVRIQEVQSEIEYDGDQPMMKDRDLLTEIESLGIHPVGMRMDSLNTFKAESLLIRNGLFSQIDLYTTPGGVLHVKMLQREPLFTLITDRGCYFVCKDKTIVPIVRTQDYYTNFLPVSGTVPPREAVETVYPLVDKILSTPEWQGFFVHIYVDPTEGIIATPRASSTKIVFGTTPCWEEKLENLRLFVQQAIPTFGWSSFVSVNLEYKDQIVTVPAGFLREMLPEPEMPEEPEGFGESPSPQ